MRRRNWLLTLITTACVVLSGCASAPEPVATVPRGEAEAVDALRDCLVDKGWEATVEGGGVTVEYPEEQRTAVQADTDKCNEDLDPAKLMSDEDRRRFYDMQVETAECLAENDARVTPPSYTVFVEEGARWNPYVALQESGAAPAGGIDQLLAICPQHTYWDALGD